METKVSSKALGRFLRMGFVGFSCLFIFCLFSPCSWALMQTDILTFDEANELYREGRYEEAALLYEELLASYPRSATFHYNLGNALFRSEKHGAAILAYERALLFEPRNKDIRDNLGYVRGLLEYRVEDKRNWYLKAAEAVLKYFTGEEILFGVLVAYLFLIGSWAFVLFFARGLPWGWKRKVAGIVLALCVVFLVGKHIETGMIRDAIVIEDKVSAHYGPSAADQVAFELGEGLKVYVVDKREGWSRVFLASQESGWVPNRQIAEVQ